MGSLPMKAQGRLPTVFIPHGGGPMPILNDPGHASLIDFLRNLPHKILAPKALLVVTAHWEAKVPTVSTADKPGMLYDYYGFPPAAYQVKYPAPGDRKLAERTRDLLRAVGLPCETDGERGFDHGTFVPLMLMYPDADVPVVQLSLVESLDPQVHVQIGRALAPLRDEGVLVLGSGLSFHNLPLLRRHFSSASTGTMPESLAFDQYLHTACSKLGPERSAALAAWAKATDARKAHPREEHLLPLLVAAAAAEDEPAHALYQDNLMGARVSGFAFGNVLVNGQ